MKSILRPSLLCFAAVLAVGDLSAADSAPLLGKPGKLLFEDDFSRAELKPKWKPGLGSWALKDGVMTAAELPADHHGAYAYADPRFAYKDIVAEYSFKFDGARSVDFKMEDSNYKGAHAGHIIRVGVTPKAVTLGDSKFGSMKNEIYEKMADPKTTPEEKKQIQASIKDKSASYKVELDTNTMHQVRVEVVGDEMLLWIDGKPVGYLKSAGVDHPTKNMVGFTVGGETAQIDNVKVWEATAAPGWAGHRAEVVGALKK